MKDIYPVPEASGAPGPWNIAGRATYEQMYKQSITDPDTFWSQQAEELLSWDSKWTLPLCKSVGRQHLDLDRPASPDLCT